MSPIKLLNQSIGERATVPSSKAQNVHERFKAHDKRMARILAGHASGLTLGQVALELYVSYSCVANTVQDIKKLLKAKTLAECVMKAHKLGYISDPDEHGIVHPTVE